MTKVIKTMMQGIQAGLYTQRNLQHLRGVWEDVQPPSPSMLNRIMTFATSSPVSHYKVAAFHKVADYMVSTMNLHLLNMLAIFTENAEMEGISTQDRDEILNEVQHEIWHIMGEISNRLSIQSLDDLVTFVNITVGLEMVSETESADSAQNWLYQLPVMYRGRLQQERLLSNNDLVNQVQRFWDWVFSPHQKESDFTASDEAHTST